MVKKDCSNCSLFSNCPKYQPGKETTLCNLYKKEIITKKKNPTAHKFSLYNW